MVFQTIPTRATDYFAKNSSIEDPTSRDTNEKSKSPVNAADERCLGRSWGLGYSGLYFVTCSILPGLLGRHSAAGQYNTKHGTLMPIQYFSFTLLRVNCRHIWTWWIGLYCALEVTFHASHYTLSAKRSFHDMGQAISAGQLLTHLESFFWNWWVEGVRNDVSVVVVWIRWMMQSICSGRLFHDTSIVP